MSFYDAIRVGASGAADFEVKRSLRFNDDDSPYLSRTPSSAGNRKTFTFSAWVKRSSLGRGVILGVATAVGSQESGIEFDGDVIRCYQYTGSFNFRIKTNAQYRDLSAWLHIVFALDTTQASSGNRAKLYVNGEQVTDLNANEQPSQNLDVSFLNTTTEHRIGQLAGSHKFDGYMAEINFIDGFQYDPSYFGETNVLTGQWNPKKYDGSYGSNGYYLKFLDNSGTTATTLGKDSSGNGNNFTPNNFSVSAGAGNDSLEDTPTNNFCTLNPLDKMGTVTVTEGNLKVVINGDNASLITGSFGVSSGKWYYEAVADTAGAGFVGWIRKDVSTYTGYPYIQGGSLLYFSQNGGRYKDGDGGAAYGASYGNGDIIGCAINLDDNEVTWYKNNSAQPTLSIEAGTYNPNTTTGGSSATFTFNFGQRAFSYTPPTGFKALNSANLPDPTITFGNQHFNTILYTANGQVRSLTGVGFQPDWVWIKSRIGGQNNALFDSVRGVNRQLRSDTNGAELTGYTNLVTSFDSDGFSLGTDSNVGDVNYNSQPHVAWNWNAGNTDGKTYAVTVVSDSGNKYRFDGFGTSAVTLDLAEGGTYIFDQSDSSNAGHPLRFSTTSNGTHGGGTEYTTGVTTAGTPGSSGAYTQIVVAASAPTLYYYCSVHSGMGGQANTNSTLGSSNFDGTIQSTVKANTTAGFSIITYTGTGADATIGHGLGVTPNVAITKKRSGSQNWLVKHSAAGSGKVAYLDLTDAFDSTGSGGGIVSDFSSSTTYSVTRYNNSGNYGNVNESSATYVAYVFSEVAGYSKFGSYTGNGSSDGTFIFTGFRPAWVLTRMSSSNNSWAIYDNTRNPFNLVDKRLRAQGNFAEDTHDGFDFLSNGFKTRNASSTSTNQNGSTYIYLAFAESPFKNSRAR